MATKIERILVVCFSPDMSPGFPVSSAQGKDLIDAFEAHLAAARTRPWWRRQAPLIFRGDGWVVDVTGAFAVRLIDPTPDSDDVYQETMRAQQLEATRLQVEMLRRAAKPKKKDWEPDDEEDDG